MEKSLKSIPLDSTITELIEELKEMTVTPHVRELRAKAVTYGRVIASWGTYAPTAPQLQAMLECVTELEEKVALAKRGEISHVARKPQAPTTRTDLPPAMRQPSARPRLEPPSVPPDGVAWNANVSSGSSRPRSKMAVTMPPAPHRQTTVPPVSAPRAIETPVPGLLRSRRQH